LSSKCRYNFFCVMAMPAMALYNKKTLPSWLYLFSEPIFIRSISYISTDHFVLQCFDTSGWAIIAFKIVPEMTIMCWPWRLILLTHSMGNTRSPTMIGGVDDRPTTSADVDDIVTIPVVVVEPMSTLHR